MGTDILKSLLGKPLSDMWKGVYQDIEFGVQRDRVNQRGKTCTAGDVHLVVDCGWRVSRKGTIAFGASDYWRHGDGCEPHSIKPIGLPTELSEGFFSRVQAGDLFVEEVALKRDGELRIGMAGDWALEVWPSGAGYAWHWYLRSAELDHYEVVCTPSGIVPSAERRKGS